MDEIRALKLNALEERQDLARLVSLYESFQAYTEALAKVIRQEATPESLKAIYLEVRHEFDDEEPRFLEWNEGEQVLNSAIYSLVRNPRLFIDSPGDLRDTLLAATVKFQHLIAKQERNLRELHERIALITSEAEAYGLTKVESREGEQPGLAEKAQQADTIGEIGIKWAGKLLRFGSWAEGILSGLK